MYWIVTPENKAIALGAMGFILSTVLDWAGTEPFYVALKYIAVIVPTIYTVWRWVRDIKRKR